MMRPRVLMLSFLTIILAITSCSRDEISTKPQAESQPSVLIQKRGEIMYRPNKKADYQSATLNMELYPDYWLQQKLGGPSKVRCAKDNPLDRDIYKLVA